MHALRVTRRGCFKFYTAVPQVDFDRLFSQPTAGDAIPSLLQNTRTLLSAYAQPRIILVPRLLGRALPHRHPCPVSRRHYLSQYRCCLVGKC